MNWRDLLKPDLLHGLFGLADAKFPTGTGTTKKMPTVQEAAAAILAIFGRTVNKADILAFLQEQFDKWKGGTGDGGDYRLPPQSLTVIIQSPALDRLVAYFETQGTAEQQRAIDELTAKIAKSDAALEASTKKESI